MDDDVKTYSKIIIWILGLGTLLYLAKSYFNLDMLNTIFADVPMDIKCAINEDFCEDGNIDGWSLVYFVAYAIIGYNQPNQYLFIFFISILIEIISMWLGRPSRFIINPLISLTGYGIGSYLNKVNR